MPYFCNEAWRLFCVYQECSMTEKVKGMSHEYIILEDGIEVARVVCDF